MLAELVFDQDSIVRVSEHTGDIIYTYEFKNVVIPFIQSDISWNQRGLAGLSK